jgi:hypothetical protein
MSDSEAVNAQEHNEMSLDDKAGPAERYLSSEKVGDPDNEQNDQSQTSKGIISNMSENDINEEDKTRGGGDNPKVNVKPPGVNMLLPAKMPKRARTAYFIFTDASRPDVQKAVSSTCVYLSKNDSLF